MRQLAEPPRRLGEPPLQRSDSLNGGLQPSLDPPGLGSRSNSLQGPPPPGVGLNNFQPPVPPPRQPTPDAQKEPRQIGLGGGLGLGGGALGGGLGGGVFGATSTW